MEAEITIGSNISSYKYTFVNVTCQFKETNLEAAEYTESSMFKPQKNNLTKSQITRIV